MLTSYGVAGNWEVIQTGLRQRNGSRASLSERGGLLGEGDIMDKVQVYITPKSPDTDGIKEYLVNEGIDFELHNVHADYKAHKRMLEATRGACGAPVIEIGNQIVCGFDKKRLEETIAYELH